MSQNGLIFKPTDEHGLLAMARRSLAGLPGMPRGISEHSLENDLVKPLLCDELLGWIDHRRWWLWGTVLVFYIAAFNGQWRVQSDSALYLSIGRNLAEGHGYTYLGQSNQLAYPGWPCVIAGVFKIFGSNSLITVNAVMTLIALATVAMVYRLFLLHSGRPVAVVISVGVGLTKAFFCYGFELWSDMPFALGTMTFLAGYEGILQSQRDHAEVSPRRKFLDWTFLLLGLLAALAMRPTGWPLLLAFAMALVVDGSRGRLRLGTLAVLIAGILLAGAAVIAMGQLRQSHQAFGGIYLQYVLNRLTGNVPTLPLIITNIRNLFAWAASDVLFQVRLGPFVNALLSAVVILIGFGLFRYRAIWGLWFCLLLLTILIAQEALDRYFLPVLPLLVFGWWELLRRINRMFPRQWGNLAFLGLLGFGAIQNVTKVTGIIIQQQSRPFLASYDKGAYEVIPGFAAQLHDAVGPDALILGQAPYGRVTAYLSRRMVVSAAEIPLIDPRGHPLFIIEPVNNKPVDPITQQYLSNAHLTTGACVFTVSPSPAAGPSAVPLALHLIQNQR